VKKWIVGHVIRAVINTVAVMGLVTFAAAGTGNAAPADSGFSWSSPTYVPGIGTSAAPSMAQCAQTAYMVWKGVADDEHLYYTSYTPGSGWAAQQQIALGNLTDTAPSVSCDSYPLGGNLMVVAWKGIGADQRVYTTSEGTGAGPTGWSAPQQVPGALTDTSPAAGMVPTDDIIPAVAKATSKPASPRFTVPAVPYLAWKNAGSNSISSTSMVNGAWQAPAIVLGAFTDVAPTMSAVLGSAYQADLTWKVAGSTSMQYAVYDSANKAWSGPAYIGGGGGTSTGVATTHVDMGNSSNSSVTAPFAVWRGIGADQRLYYTTEANPPNWAAQQILPAGALTNDNPAVTEYRYPVGPPPGGGFSGTVGAAIVAWRVADSRIGFTLETIA
jgi:hypothetical protein